VSDALPLRSSVAAADGWVALSGQIGEIDDLLVDGGAGPQTRQALHNLRDELATQDLSPSDVVKINVYLTDMADYAAMNAAYAKFFSANPPARSAIAVRGLPLDAVVEIEGWAYRHVDRHQGG
jgi:2-iminobutanoate/2-iminopropanoate deaminase